MKLAGVAMPAMRGLNWLSRKEKMGWGCREEKSNTSCTCRSCVYLHEKNIFKREKKDAKRNSILFGLSLLLKIEHGCWPSYFLPALLPRPVQKHESIRWASTTIAYQLSLFHLLPSLADCAPSFFFTLFTPTSLTFYKQTIRLPTTWYISATLDLFTSTTTKSPWV